LGTWNGDEPGPFERGVEKVRAVVAGKEVVLRHVSADMIYLAGGMCGMEGPGTRGDCLELQ
jgi:hypothetical protein